MADTWLISAAVEAAAGSGHLRRPTYDRAPAVPSPGRIREVRKLILAFLEQCPDGMSVIDVRDALETEEARDDA